jgi:hypothetical protein
MGHVLGHGSQQLLSRAIVLLSQFIFGLNPKWNEVLKKTDPVAAIWKPVPTAKIMET